ncbi:disrupted underground network [Haematobia irritans]|uniref:disrupted underground network n=1 Tax=Haematobia irritans TaxID=7368 RepID=UPI003F506B49
MADTSYTKFAQLPEPSKFKINTQYFSPHDLNLFVESLETIQRLTIYKEERKELEKTNKASRKFNTLSRIHSESHLDRSSSDDVEDEPVMHLENKKVPSTPDSQRSQYDESYFSAPNSAHSSPRNSVIYNSSGLHKDASDSLLSITISTDSEESGVFAIGTSSQDLYDSNPSPLRPRSKLITKRRSLSTRSRLIGLVLKKECAKTPCVRLISCRPLDEYETLEMYEQEQQQQQLYLANELHNENEKISRFSTLHMRKKSRQGFACTDGSSEERFLDKALRYLTL